MNEKNLPTVPGPTTEQQIEIDRIVDTDNESYHRARIFVLGGLMSENLQETTTSSSSVGVAKLNHLGDR